MKNVFAVAQFVFSNRVLIFKLSNLMKYTRSYQKLIGDMQLSASSK